LIILFLAFVQWTYAQGPGAAWTTSKIVNVKPSDPGIRFQVKITLAAGQYANMNSDGSDLRFYDNGNIIVNIGSRPGTLQALRLFG
jgi:hypothetical protein